MRHWVLLCLLWLVGCATPPPSDMDDLCEIFDQRYAWYESATKAEERWQASIPVSMAIIHQESRFRHDARPPRTRILWVIPGPRRSSAYGYAQVKEETWDAYREATGDSGADRDDFADALDFIGWYNHESRRRNGIAADDAYRLYLAYHEGHGGFSRGSYRDKPWLRDVARKVASRARAYAVQLASCREALDDRGWFHWF